MSQIARVTTWASGQVLTASALNSEFNNIVNFWNAADNGSTPWTALSVSTTSTFSGVCTFPGGSQSIPAINLGDAGTGFYKLASNFIAAAASSTAIWAWSTAGLVPVSDNAVTCGGSGNRWSHVYGVLFNGSLAGTITNDSATAGTLGEYIEASQTTPTNFAATTTWNDLQTISLTAGDWDVSGLIEANLNGSSTTVTAMGISTTSGNSAPSSGIARQSFLPPTSASLSSGSVPSFRVSIASTTSVYLKYTATFSAGNPQAIGTIRARRVR